jgi:hypothetical protein
MDDGFQRTLCCPVAAVPRERLLRGAASQDDRLAVGADRFDRRFHLRHARFAASRM